MTNLTLGSKSSLPSTTVSEFRPTTSGDATASIGAPGTQTKPAQIIKWQEYFRAQDVPAPAGFVSINSAIEAREMDPSRRQGMERARQTLAGRLTKSSASPLARLRLKRGWSQKQLADQIGTSQSHVARIENGRENVLLSTANNLARALNVSLVEISDALGFGATAE